MSGYQPRSSEKKISPRLAVDLAGQPVITDKQALKDKSLLLESGWYHPDRVPESII